MPVLNLFLCVYNLNEHIKLIIFKKIYVKTSLKLSVKAHPYS